MPAIITAGGFKAPSFQDAIVAAGATAGLKFSGDVAFRQSYDTAQADPQKWLDVSGNANDFWRGAGSGVTTDDPSFNGVVGDLLSSTYWGFDGGDFFTIVGGNPAWVEALHQANSKFTIIDMLYHPAGAGYHLKGDAYGAAAQAGLYTAVVGGFQSLTIYDAAGGTALSNKVGQTAVNDNAWNFLATSFDATVGAGGGFHYLNGAYSQVAGSNTFNSTLTGPSAGNASHSFQIAAIASLAPFNNNMRMGFSGIWQGTALSKAQLDVIWSIMRTRYGL